MAMKQDVSMTMSSFGNDIKPSMTLTTPRPNTLQTATTDPSIIRSLDLEKVSITPSPMNNRPRLFQAGHLISQDVYQRIQSEVNRKEVEIDDHQRDTDDDDQENDNTLDGRLHQAREEELIYLSQLLVSQQPKDDALADYVLSQSNLSKDHQRPPSSSTSTLSRQDTSRSSQFITENYMDRHANILSLPIVPTPSTPTIYHPYPPIDRTGIVSEHDRPYADYGHLNRSTIARECQFNLQPSSNRSSLRFNRRSFAILACTNVSKRALLDEIIRLFQPTKLQYICIGEDINEFNQQRQLNIQIVLKEKIDRRKPFLDAMTETRCNYHVTNNDLAWNEYIKQTGHFLEYNEFQSTRTRGTKLWSMAMAAAVTRLPVQTETPSVRETGTTLFTTQSVDKNAIIRQAMELAKTNVHDAMDLIREQLVERFVNQGLWYLRAFNYIRLKAQHEQEIKDSLNKGYVWPQSFPECTPNLRDTINHWIQHQFSRVTHAKCLILIGNTNTGKTCFALSLPGRVNYYQGRWSLDRWDDYARYTVYDDIPWDQFDKLGFPRKEDLLTQPGHRIMVRRMIVDLQYHSMIIIIYVTDRDQQPGGIHVRQPAIVLMNVNDAGSLLTEPKTMEEKRMADFWKKKAIIYVMGPNEYFYRKPVQQVSNSILADHQTTTSSSMGIDEEP